MILVYLDYCCSNLEIIIHILYGTGVIIKVDNFPPCTTGTHISIFMLAKSFKVEWLIVDEKVRPLHLH